MSTFVSNKQADLANLALLKATGGPLNGAKLMLYKSDVAINSGTTRAQLIDCNYAGYAQGVITWSNPSIADDGTPELIGTVPAFRPTDAVTPNTAFGCAIVTSTDTLVAPAKFDMAAPMASADDSTIVTVRYRMTSGGVAVVVS